MTDKFTNIGIRDAASINAQLNLVVLTIALHKIRPERDVLDLIRPRSMAAPSKLSLEIVDQISPVIDHVGLVDGEHGIARFARLLWQVAVTDQRYQFRGARDDGTQ